ncbi:MAG: hypothetical protein ABEN55_00180, partial [Bradymonadaceae bacterium]
MMHYGCDIDFDGSGRRSRVPIAVAVALIVAALGVVPDTATAEEPKPLKMTFVDATPDQSAAIHEKLRSV